MPTIEDDYKNLLTTKLEVPLTNRRIVSRNRLTSMLDEGLHRSLSLVIAPTGYGKTTLLVEWVLNSADSNKRIAWVNLDQYSNPPLRFWAYIISGLKKAIPNLHYNLEEYIQYGYSENDLIILNPLLNEIAESNEQIILILDDFHTITDQVVLQGLMYLIEHKPENLHLVISGRKMPELPLSRLIAQQQLLQITQENLTFTFQEIETFLKQILEVKVSQEEITAMLEASEGWIAGIQLAGLSSQSWPELDLVKNQFTNTNRQIYEYLTQEVLNSQDEQLREFLLKTSILEELTVPLCNYLLNSTKSQEMLLKIEQANLFLICLDFPNCSYRYHSLFAETLQKHLTQTYPDLVPELHRRACTWLLAHDKPGKAISHAIAAGDLEQAAEILDQHAIAALRNHDIFNLAKWIGYLSNDLFQKYPQLGIYSAFVNYHLGRIEKVQENLRQVNLFLNNPSDSQYSEDEKNVIQWEHDGLAAVLLTTTKEFSEALESIHTVLEDPPEVDPFFINFLHLNLAYTYQIVGDLSAASQFFFKGYENAVAQNNPLAQFRNLLEVSRLQMVQADLFASEQTLKQCFQLCNKYKLDESFVIFVEAALLERATEKCDLESARSLVTKVLDALIEVIDNPNLWLRLDLLYSRLVEYFLAVQDRENLEVYFKQMLKYSPSLREDIPDMPWNLIDIQVRAWMGLEADPQTSKQLEEIKVFLANKSGRMLEEQIAFNRILLAQGNLVEAQSGLQQMVKNLSSTQYRKNWLEVSVLLSLAYWRQGKEKSAIDIIEPALNYGRSQGYMMVFLREGTEMVRLLKAVLAKIEVAENQPDMEDYLRNLISSSENISHGKPAYEKNVSTVIPVTLDEEETLSNREIEVLLLLAKGKAYKEVALDLNISLNTVKSHVKHIYSKLGIKSRKEMFLKARERKLISG